MFVARLRHVDATATPAVACGDIWPMKAVSKSESKGSIESAASDGIAIDRISRSINSVLGTFGGFLVVPSETADAAMPILLAAGIIFCICRLFTAVRCRPSRLKGAARTNAGGILTTSLDMRLRVSSTAVDILHICVVICFTVVLFGSSFEKSLRLCNRAMWRCHS